MGSEMISDAVILDCYYARWSDTDRSAEKAAAVIADVRRCWRARTPQGRKAAFADWGNPTECVRYWMRVKREGE
jgi:hypothetical protein